MVQVVAKQHKGKQRLLGRLTIQSLFRKPLFDNMTDENLEENEDARNNNSTADHVTKYNQINKVLRL